LLVLKRNSTEVGEAAQISYHSKFPVRASGPAFVVELNFRVPHPFTFL